MITGNQKKQEIIAELVDKGHLAVADALCLLEITPEELESSQETMRESSILVSDSYIPFVLPKGCTGHPIFEYPLTTSECYEVIKVSNSNNYTPAYGC
ncbi:MAG: hypothetical protein WCO06_07380 [Candidatus Roizmanbacteria bacterium]